MKILQSKLKELLISGSENDILIHMRGSIREYRPGKWQVKVAYEGKDHYFYSYKGHKKDTRLNSELKALQLLADINREIDKGTFDPDVFKPSGSAFLFENAVETWIDSSDCSPEWLTKRRSIADMYLVTQFRGVDIREGIKQIHIKKFITALRNKGLSSKTIYNIIGELRAMLNAFKESIPYFPNFPEVKYQKPPIRWIGEEQQSQIFEFIPTHHRGIFTFMRYAGCRTNEARALLWKSVHHENPDTPYFVLATAMGKKKNLKENTKTKISRPLPIIPEILEVLKPSDHTVNLQYVFTFRGKPYAETTIRKIWRMANAKAHGKYGTPLINLYNGLKHSFGCQRLNDGFSLTEVQAVMGHTDIKTTQRYAEYVTSKLSNVMRGKVARIGIGTKTDEKKALIISGQSVQSGVQ